MQDGSPSRTAQVVCLFRALESLRADPIVNDVYARLFLPATLRAALSAAAVSRVLPVRVLPRVVTYVLARHRLIDDALSCALADTDVRTRVQQVLVLGAGYDSRAQRFTEMLAGRPVFEVDFPSTSQSKRELLSVHKRELPSTAVHHVAVDFLTETFDGALVRAGFIKGARTFVIWEGVSMYLTRDVVLQTLSLLHALCASGSSVVMDFWHLHNTRDIRAVAHRLSGKLLSLVGEPVLFGIHPDDVAAFFASDGYALHDLADAKTLEQRYVSDGRSVSRAMFVAHAHMLERTRESMHG